MKLLCIGDAHFRESMGYAEYIEDKRIPERREILDFIVDSAKDCDGVVLLGDQFDARNNPSRVIREFVEFIERFEGKEVYILSGNHELAGDGTSALDFLAEIKNPRWHIFRGVGEVSGLVFLPYMNKVMLGTVNDEDSVSEIMNLLPNGKALFAHYAISGCATGSGQMTDLFSEPVLNLKALENKYEKIYAGHIHKRQKVGKLTVAGSIFCNEVGETEKAIFKYDTTTGEETEIILPGRAIYKFENPTFSELDKLPANSIVKVINTDKEKAIPVEEMKVILGDRFDAYLLTEKYENTREKVHFEEGAIDLSLDSLLEIYAKSKNIDLEQLKKGFELIK